MNNEKLMTILQAPHVTEKSADQLIFKVAATATKDEVKRAIESMFEVAVESVRTLRVKGKRVRFGRIQGKRSGWKKAYVRLKEGHEIDLMNE